ncbi:Serine/threonine protein kinase PrkC, regulator of stationary phase [hydrothermal vent metagenome]|uniref:Serine/threonine protein kinase PrkC, regulator of stationary phase n=1 Tax=hydrothermal vent metagenome TaxID=652676 RepID=A0A3B1BMZ6_9ZZZZ
MRQAHFHPKISKRIFIFLKLSASSRPQQHTVNGQDATANNTASLIRIPGYQIKGVLGRGGMATVYLAVQESLGRKVALKILDPNHAQGEQFSERFLREARIVSHLMHPNIVTVFDVGIHEGYHYLSMEYIDGQDLKQAQATLSKKELLRIIKEIARALDFATRKGYVHRDVKPENIMLHEADGRVILMDFGIARSYQTTHGLTRAGSALGTPYYMSPEQNKGLSADHRSDIYSLGVVFFHMLAGYVPYDADSAVAIGIKHITAAIPVLSDELQIFQPIINTCLAKEADDRYQTAAELIEALNQISDADLAAIEKKNADFRGTAKNYHAKTLITSETSAENTDTMQATASTPKRRDRTSFIVFILLLTILIAGAAAYQQRQKIVSYTQTSALPWLTRTLEKWHPQTTEPTTPAVEKAVTVPTKSIATQETNFKIKQQKEKQKLDYIDKIQSAIDSARPGQALMLMQDMQKQLPEVAHAPKFIQTYQRLQAQLQQAQTLSRHLAQARKYFKSGISITAEKSGLLAKIEAVLKLDPDNAEALNMLQQVNLSWLNKAKQPAASWQLRKQLQKLDNLITQFELRQPNILEQQKKIQQAIHHIAQVKKLLRQADEAFDKGLLIRPSANNAYKYYKIVLSIDARNRHAENQLKKIKDQINQRITQAIENGHLTQASRLIEQAQSAYGRSDWIINMEAMLEQAVAASEPKISRIRFSATALQSLDQPPADKLQPGRTLYIGFHFQNMKDSRTLLQAILFDGAGRVQIAQKPVIISGQQGDHFFQIDLPVEGFSEGSYILELRLGNKRLLSQPFLVNNIH